MTMPHSHGGCVIPAMVGYFEEIYMISDLVTLSPMPILNQRRQMILRELPKRMRQTLFMNFRHQSLEE
jgi:hypothetical protein